MKTKIVSTVGGLPIWTRAHVIESIKAGTSIFRISSSFKTLQDEAPIYADIRSASRLLGAETLIMQDINSGVKKRLQISRNIAVEKGDLVLVRNSNLPHPTNITVDWKEFPRICKVGGIINIGDGEVALVIEHVDAEIVHCRALSRGIIKIHKAITLDGISSYIAAINPTNTVDISSGAALGYDLVALSFVKGTRDINAFWEFVNQNHPGYRPKVIAKIETKEAIDDIEEIILAVDGIMIARGDLALQVNFAELGVLQRKLLCIAKQHRKFCIVATQMFESIIDRYVPSRAEILDISNAVYEGADALMLGPETCINPDGIRAIRAMSEIIRAVENDQELT